MPEMDGFDATRHIMEMTRAANKEDYCHIVALTSYTGDDARRRALAMGAKDVIHKPLHQRDLSMMVYMHFYRMSLEEYKSKFPDNKKESRKIVNNINN